VAKAAKKNGAADRQNSAAEGLMLVMGRVLGAHGVEGWIKARAFTTTPEGLIAQRRWWLGREAGEWRRFDVKEARRHADVVLARLEGLGQREEAAAWRGASIGIPRSKLPAPPKGEVYLADLVGLTVVNREGVTLGKVTGLIETGAHAVMRVAGEGTQERLVPLVPAYVEAIDFDAGRVAVDWQSDY
jgi:16S rRNA processing protein RimM